MYEVEIIRKAKIITIGFLSIFSILLVSLTSLGIYYQVKGYFSNSTASSYNPPSITSINTSSDLKTFRDRVNNGANYTNKQVILTADINMNNETWTPIGSKDHPFTGVFKGNGHFVSNLKCTLDTDASKCNDVGFFDCIKNALIENLGLKNFTITIPTNYVEITTDSLQLKNFSLKTFNEHYIGLISGRSINSTIQSCITELCNMKITGSFTNRIITTTLVASYAGRLSTSYDALQHIGIGGIVGGCFDGGIINNIMTNTSYFFNTSTRSYKSAIGTPNPGSPRDYYKENSASFFANIGQCVGFIEGKDSRLYIENIFFNDKIDFVETTRTTNANFSSVQALNSEGSTLFNNRITTMSTSVETEYPTGDYLVRPVGIHYYATKVTGTNRKIDVNNPQYNYMINNVVNYISLLNNSESFPFNKITIDHDTKNYNSGGPKMDNYRFGLTFYGKRTGSNSFAAYEYCNNQNITINNSKVYGSFTVTKIFDSSYNANLITNENLKNTSTYPWL